MNSELLDRVLDAHGGLANWNHVTAVTAEIAVGGPFWALRGWPDLAPTLTVSMDAHREHITTTPFPGPDHRSVFDVDPERLAVQTTSGKVIEERTDPRSSFPPFDLQTTKWDALQTAYFTSAANWNYFTQPFSLTYPGVQVSEIQPWREGDETWRRLAVHFPPNNANHNPDQVFYYDQHFMLRRMDYAADATGNAPVAHYTDDHTTFDKFVFPTRRHIYRCGDDGIADRRLAIITVDVSLVRVQYSTIADASASRVPKAPAQRLGHRDA
jgi:hypothetical protein